jgi:hypothetical protein
MNAAAATVPNMTAEDPVKLCPVMMTVSPPVADPEAGLTLVRAGGGENDVNVNRSAGSLTADVPPGVVTETSTGPAASSGERAEIWVSSTGKKVADTEPKVTTVAPVKLVPTMVTGSPPEVDPPLGLTPVTVGRGGGGPTGPMAVKSSYGALGLDVPVAVVTLTSTVPAGWVGGVTVIEVALFTVITVKGVVTVPNLTC